MLFLLSLEVSLWAIEKTHEEGKKQKGKQMGLKRYRLGIPHE